MILIKKSSSSAASPAMQDIKIRLRDGYPANFELLVDCVFNATLYRPNRFFYRDEENETVSVSGDLELKEALRLFRSRTLLLYYNQEEEEQKKRQQLQEQLRQQCDGAWRGSGSLKLRCSVSLASEMAPGVTTATTGAPSIPNNNKTSNDSVGRSDRTGLSEGLPSVTLPVPVPVSLSPTPILTSPVASQGTTESKVDSNQEREQFEEQVDQEVGLIVPILNDGDIQGWFLEFFEGVKKWARSLSESEVGQWKAMAIWVLQGVRKLMIQFGESVDVLFKAISWNIEQFSAGVLRDLYEKLKIHLRRVSTIEEGFVMVAGETNESVVNLDAYEGEGEIAKEAPNEEPVKVERPIPQDAALRDLLQLEAMGFTDKRRNIELLRKYKGDVAGCIAEYLAW